MFEIPVTQEWFKGADTVSFLAWAKLNGVEDGDWDFQTTAVFTSPRFLFRYEADALAFRLKFDL